MYALSMLFFFCFLFLQKKKMCTYFVGLTMQVQNKTKNLIKNIETVPVMMFILCGCVRSTLEGAFL